MPFGAEAAKGFFVAAGFEILPILAEHVLELERLPAIHADPFDRVLVAQARSEPLRLVTRDPIVRSYLV
jgi:PIN domain nuclease of toxin-antitoxin system